MFVLSRQRTPLRLRTERSATVVLEIVYREAKRGEVEVLPGVTLVIGRNGGPGRPGGSRATNHSHHA